MGEASGREPGAQAPGSAYSGCNALRGERKRSGEPAGRGQRQGVRGPQRWRRLQCLQPHVDQVLVRPGPQQSPDNVALAGDRYRLAGSQPLSAHLARREAEDLIGHAPALLAAKVLISLVGRADEPPPDEGGLSTSTNRALPL